MSQKLIRLETGLIEMAQTDFGLEASSSLFLMKSANLLNSSCPWPPSRPGLLWSQSSPKSSSWCTVSKETKYKYLSVKPDVSLMWCCKPANIYWWQWGTPTCFSLELATWNISRGDWEVAPYNFFEKSLPKQCIFQAFWSAFYYYIHLSAGLL